MKNEDIIVSVCCITYNQEKYIGQALDSFIMQKTNFKYEIIVHDDASTDNTAKIIREYEEKYPNLIKPIYQKENQYSISPQKVVLNALEKSQGKYIALCEGDDYWIDENKLQIQVDYMEEHPNCSFTFHNAYIHDMKTNSLQKEFLPYYKEQRKYLKENNIYDVGELTLLNEIPTASYMFKKINEYPNWFENVIAGDLCVQLIHTSFGYGYYIDKVMSAYRIGIGNSQVDNWNKQSADYKKKIKIYEKGIETYKNIDKYTNYKYSSDFKKKINELKVNILLIDKYRNIDSKEYKELCEDLPKNLKIKFLLRYRANRLYFIIKKIWNKIR